MKIYILIALFSVFNLTLSQSILFSCQLKCDDDLICEYVLVDTNNNPLLPDTANYFANWNNLILSYKSNFWTIYNSKGNILVDSLDEYFTEGGSLLCASKNHKWGFYNTNGKNVIKHNLQESSCFYHGIALVKSNNKYKYIDTNGMTVTVVSPAVKKHFNSFGTQHFVAPTTSMNFDHNVYEVFPEEPYFAKKGIWEKQSKNIILDAVYDDIFENVGDFVIVSKNGKEGVFNLSQKKMVIPCIYNNISPIMSSASY